MLRRFPFMVLFAMLGTSASAQEMIDASRPQVLLNIARSYGTAELTKDSDDDPLIKGRMGGDSYFILFYDCTKGARCTQIEFRSVIDSPRGFDPDKMTEWHRKYRYGKVYTDNRNDVIVNYLVNLRGGGVTRANMEGSFDWFKQMMATFHKEMLAPASSTRRDEVRRDDDRRRDDRKDDDPPPRRSDTPTRDREPAPLPRGVGQN